MNMKDMFSYCTLIYDGSELPNALEHIKKAGYDGVELYEKDWRWGIKQLGKKGFKKLFDKSGLKVSALFGGIIKNESSLSVVKEAADIAEFLGSKYIFAVSPQKDCIDKDGFLKGVDIACDYLQKKDIQLVIHNHAGTYMESPKKTVTVCTKIQKMNFGICFDSVHFALFEDNLLGWLDELIKYIKYVHLKDMKLTRLEFYKRRPVEEWRWGDLDHLWEEYTNLEEGVLDNRSIAVRLKKLGYSGWWVPEVERKEYDRQQHAYNNIRRLKSYFK